MVQTQIRHAKPEDAPSVSRLAWRAKSSWGYSADWMDLWRQSLTITSEYLRAHESLVAVQDAHVVGVCILESHGGKGSLQHVWIDPEHQGQGIGRALVERALNMAARAGVARVEVESDPFAEAFYTRLGARRVGAVSAPMPGAPERTLPLLEFVLGAGRSVAPDNTAVRVALWRALHVEVDSPPHVLEDEVGLKLVAPDDGWRSRPDMSAFTRPFRAAIVARARFIEDLVAEQAADGVGQYVILGAGLDTFAQRRPELASRVLVFEIDQPGPQAWKRQRLVDLGLGIPSFLRLVPVDFEAGDAWWERLAAAGFDPGQPAVVASTGVSMYLTREAITATLRHVATLAPGSTLAMSFLLPIEQADPEVRPGIERAIEGARANGTPFISFFTPTEMLTLARDSGFREVQHVSAATLAQCYFSGRTDGLRPPSNSEELLVATT